MFLLDHRESTRFLLLLACATLINSASVKSIFSASKAVDDVDAAKSLEGVSSALEDTDKELSRVPRDNKYFLSRYASADSDAAASGPSSRSLKPEESPEARQAASEQSSGVEKRCSRCGYGDYYDRYDSRSRYGGSDDRYRSRYPDYDYDRYDKYDRYDRYDSRDRGYDRYDRDRYDRDRYDRYDRYDRDRYQDRGIGYDNRGYDFRGSSRPYDDISRGYDRGGYASGYNYGRGGDDYYYRDRGYDRNQKPLDPPIDRYGGYGGGYGGSYGGYGSSGYGSYGGGYGGYSGSRGRDPYNAYPYDNGYRGTSYLYGRPSSTSTTLRPSSMDDNSVTDSPQQTNSPSG
ncbi:heterogeneous nuclear ribonucleoprotein A3-like isoform X3 [Atheta coriaria]|uniref:heterogeneous nuclear ribonucleoprotein A3-like isoform X3 n=1 Tax=Dalotia coriaria TaxID=877792 RepID=UPI0031F3E6E5